MGYTLLIELDNKDIDQFFADNRDGDNGYVIDVTVDQAWFWRSTDNDFIGPETFGPSDSRESAIARAVEWSVLGRFGLNCPSLAGLEIEVSQAGRWCPGVSHLQADSGNVSQLVSARGIPPLEFCLEPIG